MVREFGLNDSAVRRLQVIARMPKSRLDVLHAEGVRGITALAKKAEIEFDASGKETGHSTHGGNDEGVTFTEFLERHLDGVLEEDEAAKWRNVPAESRAHRAILALIDLGQRNEPDPRKWLGPATVLKAYERWVRRGRLISDRAAAAIKATNVVAPKVNIPRERFDDIAA